MILVLSIQYSGHSNIQYPYIGSNIQYPSNIQDTPAKAEIPMINVPGQRFTSFHDIIIIIIFCTYIIKHLYDYMNPYEKVHGHPWHQGKEGRTEAFPVGRN